MLDIKLNLAKISKLNKFDFNEVLDPLQLRVSFFDSALDLVSSPIIFSQEKLVKIGMANEIGVTWDQASLPCLHSAHNTPELASSSRLMIFIWACGPAQHFPEHEMLLGQVNL